MSQTISRLYGTPQTAIAVTEALKERGFAESDIVLVAYSGGHEAGSNSHHASVEGITQAITAGLVLKAHAKIYAEGVSRGGSLVTVHAPFGTAAEAVAVLDSFDPIPSGLEESAERPIPWDDATPASSALHMRVLLDDSPTPFSDFWNLPVLLDKAASLSAWVGLPLLAHNALSVSSQIGLPLLTGKATSVSELIGLPVLLKSRSRWL